MKRLLQLAMTTALGAGLTTQLLAQPLPAEVGNKKPNIILILVDDLGYECMGANGGESYKTPALDKMAQTGIRFNYCYAQPLCTPSRVQIMTGIYNVRNYRGWANLDPSQTTFANLLKKAGYVTCMAGKWQLGDHGIATLPKHFGFDESYLFPYGSYHWGPSLVLNGRTEEYRPEDYGPDLVSDQACRFIERNKSKPFFLYYTEHLPHDPFLPTPDSHAQDVQKYATGKNTLAAMKLSNKKYFRDMVEYMDKLCGKLMATLDAQGLRENTLVIFTGDNGTGAGVPSVLNGRTVIGGKGEMTDAGTHVPLIVRWPAGIKKAGVCDDLVDFTDFLPTICEAAGAAIPAELKVDGRSFLPQLRGEPGHPREWCYCWFSKDGRSKAAEWARNHRYKLYRTGEFYDVSNDVLEKQPLANLSSEAKEARILLQQALDRYRDARPAELLDNVSPAK
ncbi:MAG: sulfatase-like hydrolase/transferase [Verrucomicrobiota bacterium]